MLYSISDLYYNNQIKELNGEKLHITLDNARLFFLSTYKVELHKLGTDMNRECEEYKALGIPKEKEEEWLASIYLEIISHIYTEDLEFARDYLHLFRFLKNGEEKTEYLKLLDKNILRFKVNDARMMDCFNTIYQLINDKDVSLKDKEAVLLSIRTKYEAMGISENANIGSYYQYFLKGLIPTIGLGDEHLDNVLYSMIPDNFIYFMETSYPSEQIFYAYMFGIDIKRNYDLAYNELKKLIPSLVGSKKLELMISGINRRSHRNYTIDDIMSYPAEIDLDELYFNTPGTKITMENAKRYYQFMCCSWFLIGKEYRERAKELRALSIPFETYQEWEREYVMKRVRCSENDEALWNMVMAHPSVVHTKEDSLFLFTHIKPILESRILYDRDITNILDYFESKEQEEVTGFIRTFLINGLKDEIRYLLKYIKKCMKAKENKGNPSLSRVKHAIKLVKRYKV